MIPGYFKCQYCYTFSKDKFLMKKHEDSCTYNPINKHCDSCRYRELRESEEQVKEYICTKGYNIDKSYVDCNAICYSRASIIELKKRAENEELQQ